MPAQDGIGCHDRRDLAQHLSAKQFSPDGKTPALIVVEQDPLLPELLSEDLVFGADVLDDALLFLIRDASQDSHQQMPRLQNEVSHRFKSRKRKSGSAEILPQSSS